MTPNEYQIAALSTMADQQKILDRLVANGPKAMQLINGSKGLADDCGEVNGCIKKYIEYGKALDVVNLVEECGDVIWRVCQILDAVGHTLEDCFETNLKKLGVRYKEGYSDEAANNRNLEEERKALESSVAMRPISPSENASITITAGEGYRLLDKAELVEKGDEFYSTLDGGWVLSSNWRDSCKQDKEYAYRRKMKQPTQSLEQNGQGWSEPPEESEEPILKEGHRAPLDSSYDRYCVVCNINRVYCKSNAPCCPDCYPKWLKQTEGAV